jgi:MFS superfamily sulfate permease-like transporter
MRVGDFEFNRRELAGAMGDFGTLLPLAAGYIAVCGLDPAGFLVTMGLVNVALGLIYRLPMPLEPKKVVAVVAIAERWSPALAQIPLILTNATIATAALIRDYFPEKAVPERKLVLNMGVMNALACFFGGMPMCHGAGGLAGQYYFGARTGGASILEGLIEIGMGLFMADSLLGLFRAFPEAILGAMMVLVAWQLARRVVELRGERLVLALLTGALAVVTHMAVGAFVGVVVYHLWRWWYGRRS